MTSDEGFTWCGVLEPSLMHRCAVTSGHGFADAAKAGDWPTVFRMLDDADAPVDLNWWRPGGTAWFTVLHQVAWHGGPAEIAAELVRRGALRSLPDAKGRTAHDIRVERDRTISDPIARRRSRELCKVLKPPVSSLQEGRAEALDTALSEVINGRTRGILFDRRDPQTMVRYPPVEILHEVPDGRLWFPVPGMYGGFDIHLRQGYLECFSWCRVVGGSGQAHVITHQGAVLVDQGFV